MSRVFIHLVSPLFSFCFWSSMLHRLPLCFHVALSTSVTPCNICLCSSICSVVCQSLFFNVSLSASVFPCCNVYLCSSMLHWNPPVLSCCTGILCSSMSHWHPLFLHVALASSVLSCCSRILCSSMLHWHPLFLHVALPGTVARPRPDGSHRWLGRVTSSVLSSRPHSHSSTFSVRSFCK